MRQSLDRVIEKQKESHSYLSSAKKNLDDTLIMLQIFVILFVILFCVMIYYIHIKNI